MRGIVKPLEPRKSFLRVCSVESPVDLASVDQAVESGLFTRQQCRVVAYLRLSVESFDRLAEQFQRPMRIWQKMGGVSDGARNVIFVFRSPGDRMIAVDSSQGDTVRWVALP